MSDFLAVPDDSPLEGNDLLHERKTDALRYSHARRPRQGKGKTPRANDVSQR